MKAILEFNLPEDNTEHRIAVYSMDWALAMNDLDQWLRDELKFHKGPKAYETVRSKIREILAYRNISLEDIN